jgi:hypothetical protein
MITDANDFVRDPRRSSGPRTEEGKARSSRNSLKFGLFTARDFIREGEEEEHAKILTSFMSELAPEGTTEEIFAIEIVGATWRLRRCRLVEEAFGHVENLDVDPIIDERTEKQQKSVDRARAQSHLILRRSLAELRNLQKRRTKPVPEPESEPGEKLFVLSYHAEEGGPPHEIVYSDGRHWRAGDPPMEDTPVGQVPDLPSTESVVPKTPGSFCNPASKTPPAARPIPADFPRNAQCPCRSGQKYKRCCGKNAPPVLNRAA